MSPGHTVPLLGALLLPLSACTLQPGAGWADVGGLIAARFVPDQAHSSSGAELLSDQGYAVDLDELKLELAGLRLYQSAAGDVSATTSFDPANPPPGYTLCHGGHCHSVDGEVISYEELAAQMAAGGAQPSEQVYADLDSSDLLDLLAGQQCVVPAVPVGKVRVSSVAALVSGLQASGSVLIDDAIVPLAVELRADPAVAVRTSSATGLPLSLGPDGPISATLCLELVENGDLFDQIRFANLARDGGTIAVDADHAGNAAAYELLLARLAVLPATVDATQP